MPPRVVAGYAASFRRGWLLFWSGWVAAGAALCLAGLWWWPLWLIGLPLVAVMGAMLALTLRRLRVPGPVIVIDAQGFHDRRLGDPVPWHAITAIRRHQPGNRIFLQIAVADPARYLGNAGLLRGPMLRVNPALGMPALGSSLSGLDVPQPVLADAAAAWWAAAHHS